MNDLQIALLGAGVAAVAGVWAYNTWDERKQRATAERLFKGAQADVLLDEAPAVPEALPEPTADAVPEPALERIEPAFERIEPAFERIEPAFERTEPTPEASVETPESAPRAPDSSEMPAATAVSPAPTLNIDTAPVDPVAECLVHFCLPAPAPAGTLWQAQAQWSAEISKPLRWLARGAIENNGPEWNDIDAQSSAHYVEWIAALQLADRQGAASEHDVSRFCEGLAQLASQFGAPMALPDRAETLARAQALDEFCAGVDVQFSIHVVEASGGSFPGTKLRGVCEAAGLALGQDGAFHSFDEQGTEEFSIANSGGERFSAENIRSLATHGVSLTIDVPRVSDGAAAFTRMINTAQQLARGVGGVLVDAQRAPLGEAMISGIRAKIVELQQKMKAAQIPAGSTRALKLFS